MSEAPLPRFTIEDLLRDAVEAMSPDERCVFTTRELARLWKYESLSSVRRQMDKLTVLGWVFTATRKPIVSRAGVLTSTIAYAVVPPSTDSTDTKGTQ